MDGKLPTENLRRGGGRPKGVPNKTTASAKAIIESAATKLGGAARLLAWAQEAPENERVFWATIFPKLLPVQVTGENGGPIKTEEVGAGAAKLAALIDGIAERQRSANDG